MPDFDGHRNFSYSTVVSAPPAGGSALALQTGDGAAFPSPPFNCTVWTSANPQPLTGNAEIIRVTGVNTDTLYFQRTAEAPFSAIAIAVGDQIAATISVKTLTDVETMSGITTRILAADLFR